MPEIEVYIDSELASANNWQSFVPTTFDISPLISGAENVINVFITNSTLSGANNVQIEAPFDSPGYVNTNNSSMLFTTGSGRDSYIDAVITNEIGTQYDELIKIQNDLYIAGGTYSWTNDVETEFGINANTINILNDSEVDFKIYIGSAPAKRDTVVDLTISDDVYFYCGLDMFSATARNKPISYSVPTTPGSNDLFIVANSAASDSFFNDKNLEIVELFIDLYRVTGDLGDIVSLFYVPSYGYTGNLKQTLEYTGAFSGVTELFGSKEFQVAFVSGYDAHSGGGCTGSIKSNNTVRMYSAVGIADYYYRGSYYDPNYIKDVSNNVNILYNPHVQAFTNPPQLYDADTKEILFYFNYAQGRVCVLIEHTEDLSITYGNCEGHRSGSHVIDLFTYEWLHNYPNYTVSYVPDPEYLDVEISTTSGIIYGLYTDLCSAGLRNNDCLPTDMFCCPSGIVGIPSDIDIALGSIIYSTAEIFSVGSVSQDTMSSGSIQCDVRTWSMFFGDFFLDVEDFTTSSSTCWADVVDYMWPIDLNESYFLVDGQRVAVTFSGIVGGQRMFYNPPNDFYSERTLTYTAHFTNSAGDVMERDYYLLYGYDINFVDAVDWGAHRQVEVLAYAKNKAFCPNKGSGAFYFVTRDYSEINLGSFIRPLVPSDLSSTVKTQSTAFYYGSTYKITVSGIKDFAGNYLDSFEYSFTIEDPTD